MRFPASEYPPTCEGKSAEQCAFDHLNFLVNTETIQYLHNRYENTAAPFGIGKAGFDLFRWPYDQQLFYSFVAPDRWNDRPHIDGPGSGRTPGDIKGMYRSEYLSKQGQEYISLFGRDFNFDMVGNLTFGYIGSAAGYDRLTLVGGHTLRSCLTPKVLTLGMTRWR